jgi:hypothetical protein
MSSAYQIVVNTPLWVWPLMLFVLWLGWYGLQPRTMPPARLAILPLVGLATSLAGIAQSLQPGLALAGWAVALLAALPLGYAIGTRRAVRLRPEDGRLEVAAMVRPGLRHLDLRRPLHAGRPLRRDPGLRVEPLWIVLSGGAGALSPASAAGWPTLLRAYRPAVVRSQGFCCCLHDEPVRARPQSVSTSGRRCSHHDWRHQALDRHD